MFEVNENSGSGGRGNGRDCTVFVEMLCTCACYPYSRPHEIRCLIIYILAEFMGVVPSRGV